jgi:hypothetical protein
MTALWPIIIFVIKLIFVGLTAVLLAITLALTVHELRTGALYSNRPGTTCTRKQNPIRYWLRMAYRLLFIIATVVVIRSIIHLG